MNHYKILSLVLILLNIGPAYAQTRAIYTLPSEVNVLPKDSLEIPLTLTTDSLVTNAQIIVEFDSTKLKFVDVLPGNDINGFAVIADKALTFPPSVYSKNKNVKITVSANEIATISGENLELVRIKSYITGFNGNTTIEYDRGEDRTFLTTSNSNIINGGQIQFNPGAFIIIPDTTAMLSLATDTMDVLEGKPFQAQLNISQVTDLHNFLVSISFDPSLICVDSVKEGEFLNNSGQEETTWFNPKVYNSNGLVENIKCVREDTFGVNGEGTLATIYFRSLMQGMTQIQFIQPKCQLNDPMNNNIPIADFSDLSINIYRQPVVELALPDTFAASNRYIDLPLNISGVSNFDIISALIEVQFDSSCLKGIDITSQGTLTENWQVPMVNNLGTSLYFALAGSSPLAGDGVLVYLRFFTNPLANENDECDLKFVEVMLNEGDPTIIHHDGHFRIRGFQIAGSVKYQGTGIPVPNTRLQLSGQQTLSRFTDINGNYSVNGLHYGDFILRPQKTDDQGRSITPFDAALILQYVVGTSQLTPYQLIAADVSGDSTISAFDASLIMRYSVRLEDKFPVMADSLDLWDFVPTSYPINDTNWISYPDSLVYQPLEKDQFNQNFIGIIYGDVSQNWISPAMQSIEVEKSGMITTLELGNFQIAQPGIIEIPIHLEGANSVYSAEIELEFHENELHLINVTPTKLSTEFLINYNHKDGRLKIALAGTNPIVGSGSLVKMRFKINKSDKIYFCDKINLNQAWLNDQPIQNTVATTITTNPSIPKRLELSPNYPNPFNQETVFQVSIPEMRDNKILLVIYNLRGQVVRTLLDGDYEPGEYAILWDGIDENGCRVTSGEYFCILKAVGKRVVQKFILLR